MKKMLLVFTLALCCVGAFAGGASFNEFFAGVKSNLPSGCSARKDTAKRIIFVDMPLNVDSSTGFDEAAGKKAVVKELKGTPDADAIKEDNILLIYNFVTTDQKIFSVVISKEDL